MTAAGQVYGRALYDLAREEGLTQAVWRQLQVVERCFREEPDVLRLLDSHNLSKEERCRVLEQCFRGNVHDYVLHFLKLLTEKGRIRQLFQCVSVFRERYEEAYSILPVQVTTAAELTGRQARRLEKLLAERTGKEIVLTQRVDPAVLGGVRLDYGGKRVEDTVVRRLERIRERLGNTVL